MKFINRGLVLFLILLTSLFSCKPKAAPEEKADPVTPVTVTSITYDPIQEYIDLNATSTFLQKNVVKANLNGYIKGINIKYGSYVSTGQTLFVLKTKEANALGNTINKLDPSFKFSGVNLVKASLNGYVTELDHQIGDYVADGEQLAIISDMNSFMFVVNVPYEFRPYVTPNKQVEVTLPDGERMLGTVQSSLPFVDSLSQTQAIAIRVNSQKKIPQNLVAKVRIIKSSKAAASSLPKNAVLSDETQADHWVMQMINDSTAVKVPVKVGLQTADKVEILSPTFKPTDKIVLTGNYGLGDTAKVMIPSPKQDTTNEKKEK